MTARTKLNRYNVAASFGIAAIIGWAAASWTVFILFWAMLLAVAYSARAIRA